MMNKQTYTNIQFLSFFSCYITLFFRVILSFVFFFFTKLSQFNEVSIQVLQNKAAKMVLDRALYSSSTECRSELGESYNQKTNEMLPLHVQFNKLLQTIETT